MKSTSAVDYAIMDLDIGSISPRSKIPCPVSECRTVCGPGDNRTKFKLNITHMVAHAFSVVLRVPLRIDTWRVDNIPIDAPYSENVFYECYKCGEVVDEDGRIDHGIIHDGYKRFQCPESPCREEFRTNLEARLHVHDLRSWGDARSTTSTTITGYSSEITMVRYL